MLSALIPSEHSYPAMLLAEQLVHKRFVRPGPLVLRSPPLKSPAPTADTIRTVSRRSKPSSRTALMGEQPNPWDLLQPQDATSRHRGAKPCRRCDALQSPAAQTIPLSLLRQWRVMKAVDLAGLWPGPPSLAMREVVTGEACRACSGSRAGLQGSRNAPRWLRRCEAVGDPCPCSAAP